jgi:hypothetical protein
MRIAHLLLFPTIEGCRSNMDTNILYLTTFIGLMNLMFSIYFAI